MTRHPRTRLCRSVFALTLVCAAPSAAQHFPEDEDLQLMLRYLVEDAETPGIVVAMLEADGTSRILSYGSAGPDARPLGPQSVFEIGSINKTFTGVLLAQAVARGEAALDDPVQRFMPSGVTVPTRNGREITLLDLTTHTSGLPRLPDNHTPEDRQNPYADYTVEEMYEFLSNHELRRDPGAEWEYSNIGVGLLGHALARAAGRPFVDLVRERITEPLGMEMTGYALEGAIGEWMTQGHGDGAVVPYWFATESIQGAGGLRSNIEDMLVYLEANVRPEDSDLGRAIRAAHQPRRDDGDGSRFGLGWGVRETPDGPILAHGGGTGGFSTYIVFNPTRGVGAVRLTNTTGFGDDLMRDFVVRGPPLDIPEVEVDRETLSAYTGEYSVGGRPLWVRLEDEGWLTMQIPGNVRFKLYAESDTAFFVKRAPYRLSFSLTDDGVALSADLNGSRRSGERLTTETPEPRVAAGNRVPERMSAELMSRYEGQYAVDVRGTTRTLAILARDERLWVQLEGQSPLALVRVEDDTFALQARQDYRVIFDMEDGRAVAVTLDQAGETFQGPRVP